MSLVLRSAARAWSRRPAGPVLVLLGVLVATVLAAGTDLALVSAEATQRADDERALGDELARVWTPGGYTVDETRLDEVRRALVAAGRPADRLPVFLERDALLSSRGTTTPNWRVVGLEPDAFAGLGLPTPAPGAALVDTGSRDVELGSSIEVRVQRAPRDDVLVRSSFQGNLARTVLVGGQYVHDQGDSYEFAVEAAAGAKRLDLFLSTANNDTDYDLEAVSPSGAVVLDDAGTAAAPVQPRIEVEEPEPGGWTVRVHAKLADSVAFRLEVVNRFDASDAQALGRLLAGQGWRAVGAELGLTEQATLPLEVQRADLSALGPGTRGLVVVPVAVLRAPLGLDDRATGLLVLASGDESVLDGLGQRNVAALQTALDGVASGADGLDPVRGLRVDATADRAAAERLERIRTTERLLDVVLPAGVAAGVLLATWATGLHARRLRDELQVLAGLGQKRSTSYGMAAAHLAPAVAVGAGLALVLAPLLALAIAAGVGLDAAGPARPGADSLLVPLVALAPISVTVWATLRHAVTGQDPRAERAPAPTRTRLVLVAAGLVLAVVVWAGLSLASPDPTARVVWAGAAGALLAATVLWAPALEPLLRRPALLSAPTLGLHRTRTAHPYLALAAGAVVLVLAALLSGLALSNAASPDVERESGGYAVIATTPSHTEDLSALVPPAEGGRGGQLLQRTLGIEYVMRVEGTGIHSASDAGVQTVYGIDTSFAQRHAHDVRVLGQNVADPVDAVARGTDLALVTPSLVEGVAADGTIAIEGPLGRLPYTVVGVLDTRLLEGVYVSKQALPTHFNQIAGEQRIKLGPDADAASYAASVQDVWKDQGLTAASSEQMVRDQLQGQLRAGATLQALAALGLVTALLLVVLIGLRAQAERREADAVLSAMGATTTSIAIGIATETLMPLAVGIVLGAAVVLPAVATLDQLEGLAFPLTPIDTGALVEATLWTAAGALVVAVVISALLGWRAAARVQADVLRGAG